MKDNLKKVAVVTGGTSGIGLATCKELADRGFKVFELSRSEKGDPSSDATHIKCDITDEKAVKKAISAVFESENRLDALVNNAGFGISGAVEFTETAEAKRQFDVNFFGSVTVIKACLPFMRKCGGGRIINISSVAAELSIPFQAFYSSVKAAISSLTLALRNELKPFGITVCAVLPGDVKTGFTNARKKNEKGDDVYGGRISKGVAAMEKDEKNGMPPKAIAKVVARLAEKKNVKPFYTCGFKYKLILLGAKLLPRRFSNWVIGKLY